MSRVLRKKLIKRRDFGQKNKAEHGFALPLPVWLFSVQNHHNQEMDFFLILDLEMLILFALSELIIIVGNDQPL